MLYFIFDMLFSIDDNNTLYFYTDFCDCFIEIQLVEFNYQDESSHDVDSLLIFVFCLMLKATAISKRPSKAPPNAG